MKEPTDVEGRARAIRGRAARVRYVALGLSRIDDRGRLQEYALELDHQADHGKVVPIEPVGHQQQQIKQQQQTEKPEDDES
jgi:hypothetical protein